MHEQVFDDHESEVRYYSRRLPNLLQSARGAKIYDVQGREFVDFLSACGAMNYGHSHPQLKRAAMAYLLEDGLTAGLDFHTTAKLSFIQRFVEKILAPKGLRYRLQFPSPSGTNCVEAALKLARKATGRHNVVAFTNAFHGVSAGALSVTGSKSGRRALEGQLHGVTRLPFDGYHGAGLAELARFEAMATDPSGGVEPVAAFIVETVQGEGGLNVASDVWLRELSAMTDRLGSLLIIDDIQAGCGRCGTFFSFEGAGISPDIVCLAKSISGYGFPMSLLLIEPEIDVWSPGEHNGTFRGNSLAFVTAAAALDLWTDEFVAGLGQRCELLTAWCRAMEDEFSDRLRRKGRGMMQGLQFELPEAAHIVASRAIADGILLECCGPRDEVVKILAPLNIGEVLFTETLARLSQIVREVLASRADHDHGLLGLPLLQEDQSRLDPYDDRTEAIGGAELAHGVRQVKFDGLLGDA